MFYNTHAIKYPAVLLQEGTSFSIVEACCYLKLSIYKFRQIRSNLGIHPISMKKPYLFLKEDLNPALVYLFFYDMINDPLIPGDTPGLTLKEFLKYHLYLTVSKYYFINRKVLYKLHCAASKKYRVVWPSLRKYSKN
jgi:hypothetical protein